MTTLTKTVSVRERLALLQGAVLATADSWLDLLIMYRFYLDGDTSWLAYSAAFHGWVRGHFPSILVSYL